MSSFSGHTKKVNDVHCDNNQVLIVSSSDDGTIKLWDSRIGKDFRTLRVHTGDAVLCAKMRSTGRDNILVVCPTTTTKKKKLLTSSNRAEATQDKWQCGTCTRHTASQRIHRARATQCVTWTLTTPTTSCLPRMLMAPVQSLRPTHGPHAITGVYARLVVIVWFLLSILYFFFFSFLSHFSLFIFGFDEHRHSVVTGFVDGAVLVSKISHES